MLEQGPQIRSLARILLRARLPRPRENPALGTSVVTEVPAPSARLVRAYKDWCGKGARYANALPPHLVSHWGLPLVGQILEQTRYPIARVLNQGATLRMHAPLPAGEPLHVEAKLASLVEAEGRARLGIDVTTGTRSTPEALVATFHVVFLLGGSKDKKKQAHDDDASGFEDVGRWRAEKNDGLGFALLTGDFNPIHWIALAGKLSPFKRTVLHGFGTFARTYERLPDAERIRSIDVRFLKPVPLPSVELRVRVKTSGDERTLALLGEADTKHLAGTYALA